MIHDLSQEKAVEEIIKTPGISVLTGGPGRGKTFTVRSLLSTLWSLNSIHPDKTWMACPTGKAAKVLQDALGDMITNDGHTPATIHRLLGCRGLMWEYNSSNRLPADCIIIDEASMVDSAMLARIIDSISIGCKIVLVGDADQLPPVSAGNPFHDIVKAGINVNRLEINHRQQEGSLIADACDKIITGVKPNFGITGEHSLGGKREDDFFHIQEEDKEEIPGVVASLAKQWNIDEDDYCILAPQRTGPCGVENLNLFLQDTLNPPARDVPELIMSKWLTLREGDKVLHTKNNYELEVFNGFTGRIVGIDTSDRIIVVDYDGRLVTYNQPGYLAQLTLGYCLTVHKSQGSQFKYGVVACHSTHSYMWSRQLLYTAVSRFKEALYIVGDKKGLQRARTHSIENVRNTYLDLAFKGEAQDI